jgi:hypothetical protein
VAACAVDRTADPNSTGPCQFYSRDPNTPGGTGAAGYYYPERI